MTEATTQKQKTPVAVFLFNRPAHTRLVLDSLSHCSRLDDCSVHIYCDGPKRPEDSADAAAVREIARDWASRFDAQMIEREMNLGLARSIANGVSELCESHGRVIVVEDDFLLSPSFLDYMLTALDRYADEPNVYQVSGYMFPIRHSAKPDAFFLPLTTTWGWATWSRAWRIFNWEAENAQDLLHDSELRRRFNLNNAYPYAEMLEGKLAGENDSWGILFWWAVFRANGLVLHPRKSLVWNGGFDETGTHCGDQAWSNQSLAEIRAATRSFVLPDKVAVDELAFRKVVRFLRAAQSEGNLIERIRRRILQRRARQEERRLHVNNAP